MRCPRLIQMSGNMLVWDRLHSCHGFSDNQFPLKLGSDQTNWTFNSHKFRNNSEKQKVWSSPLSSMEFMESSLGRKCVPMRSDMEWAAESLCVPASSGLLTFASGWGCGSGTRVWRLGSESHMAERGKMAEDVSETPPSCFRPFILSLSLEKGERGFSFMERSNMLAVMLFLMNWMLTWIWPRSFFFFPGLDSKEYQLKWERRKLKPSQFNETIYAKKAKFIIISWVNYE